MKNKITERRISFTSSANFTGDTKIQKSISNLEDSEEKKKKRDQKHIKKKNNDFIGSSTSSVGEFKLKEFHRESLEADFCFSDSFCFGLILEN